MIRNGLLMAICFCNPASLRTQCVIDLEILTGLRFVISARELWQLAMASQVIIGTSHSVASFGWPGCSLTPVNRARNSSIAQFLLVLRSITFDCRELMIA